MDKAETQEEPVSVYDLWWETTQQLAEYFATDDWNGIAQTIDRRQTLLGQLIREDEKLGDVLDPSGRAEVIRRILDADQRVYALIKARMASLSSEVSDQRHAAYAYGAHSEG